MEFIQSKIIRQQRAANVLHTKLHLLLEIRPNRYLVKADIVVNAIDGVFESVTYEIDPNIFNELKFARGIDVTGKNKKALDKFIMEHLEQMVNDDRK